MGGDTTGVPGAIDALVAALSANLKPARVVDGPATNNVTGDVVWVGITPDDPSLDAPDDAAGLGRSRITFDINCLARSWSGSADTAKQRTRAYALVSQVKAALTADKTLGGAVMQARFAGSLYTPYYDEQSRLVIDVVFRVAVTTYA